MNENIFDLILAIIPVLGVIITGFLIPFIKEKIGSEKLVKYEYWVTTAVQAAEMLYTESGSGAEKKQYVVNFLNDMFNKNKVVITEDQLNLLVEAAVKQMKMDESN